MADVPEDLYDEVVRRLMRCPAENTHISINFLRNALADELGGDEELRAALAMVYAAGRAAALEGADWQWGIDYSTPGVECIEIASENMLPPARHVGWPVLRRYVGPWRPESEVA